MSKATLIAALAATTFFVSMPVHAAVDITDGNGVTLDAIPFGDPGNLGAQVHSDGTLTDQTSVFGHLVPNPLAPATSPQMTFLSTSVLDINAMGHAFVDGPFDDMALFFTNGELFSAIEFNIDAAGQGNASASGIVRYFFDGDNVSDGQFNFTTAAGDTKYRIFGQPGQVFSRIEFRADANSSYAGIRQVDVRLAAVPEPASWAMMLGGFAMLGAALRRQHKMRTVVA